MTKPISTPIVVIADHYARAWPVALILCPHCALCPLLAYYAQNYAHPISKMIDDKATSASEL